MGGINVGKKHGKVGKYVKYRAKFWPPKLTEVVVVILIPEEYNMMYSNRTILQQFHKCIHLAVARDA